MRSARPPVIAFLTRRLMQAALTILGVLAATFFLVRAGGDPVSLLLPVEASQADVARLRAALGLDRSVFEQFATFVGNAAHGDFGNSLRQNTPALRLVLDRLPATLELAGAAFLLGIGLAFVAGLAMRLIDSRVLRASLLWLAFTRQAIPVFWFGLLMILLFSVTLGWLPSLGRGGLDHLILPAVTLGTYEFGLYLRLFNAALAKEAGLDYVRTAYAKGQTRVAVTLRDILPNALLPLITIAGLNLGTLLGGAVVTETVFSWPGVGRLVIDSVSQRDYPVVITGVLVVCVIFVAANLVVDLLYGVLDPRVRVS